MEEKVVQDNRPRYRISDDSDPRKHFFMIPNLIDDLPLSLVAVRLYIHLKRVAGENGNCWQSVRTLSSACRMSMGSVTKARRELVASNLIDCSYTKNQNGGRSFITIRIKDIWGMSAEDFPTSSPGERSSSPHERSSSLSELNNTPINNTPIINAPQVQTQKHPAEEYRRDIQSAIVRGHNLNYLLTEAIQENFHISPNWKSKQWQAVLTHLKNLGGADPVAALEKFAGWWYHSDWRGKQGQPPNAGHILELWPQAFVNSCESSPELPPPCMEIKDEAMREYIRRQKGTYYVGDMVFFNGVRMVEAEKESVSPWPTRSERDGLF